MPRAYMTRGRSGRCCDSSPLGRLRSPATRTLGRDAGIDGKTAKTHLDVLERLFLVRIRRPWHANLGKRQVKAPKAYVADTGLQAGLIGIDGQRVRNDDGLAGALFETFVATELERQASWSVTPLTFWHYREQEREVDIIAERPFGELVGIEVKASATVRERDFQGLKHMRDQLGSRLRAGIDLHRSAHASVRCAPLCGAARGPLALTARRYDDLVPRPRVRARKVLLRSLAFAAACGFRLGLPRHTAISLPDGEQGQAKSSTERPSRQGRGPARA
jgi:Domain of unknown function (DUF4143)